MKTKCRASVLTATILLLTILTFPAMTGAGSPQGGAAGVMIYVEIGDLTHGIGGIGHENEVPITAAMHGITHEYDPEHGMPTGSALHNTLDIVKPLDQISPFLPKLVATSDFVPQVFVRFYRAGPSGEETPFYIIQLDNAWAVKYGMEESGQLGDPYEGISFTYQRATWTDVASGNSTYDDWWN